MRLALDTTLRSRGAGSARSCASTIALMKQRAQGKPGAHDTRSRAQKCTRRTAGAPEHPAFPAQWFYGLCRALPGDEFLLPPSLTDWPFIGARLGPTISISLTPATGARTTRFCRPQLPRAIRLDRPACCQKKFRLRRLSAVRLRAVRSLTGITALRPRARPTLPRPPQPVPTFVTMANAPLLGTG